MSEKVKSVIERLNKNNMEAYFFENCEKMREFLGENLKSGAKITSGGSVTLKQSGVIDFLSCKDYNFLDRNLAKTLEESDNICREAYTADYYFMSSNAVTENGELINVDGKSNRTSALLFGPKEVYVIVGINKIVKNINEGFLRVKKTAAPQNTVRLSCNTYCQKTGECVVLKNGEFEFASGCMSEDRICCNFVVSAYQRQKGRIKVLIVGEELGY